MPHTARGTASFTYLDDNEVVVISMWVRDVVSTLVRDVLSTLVRGSVSTLARVVYMVYVDDLLISFIICRNSLKVTGLGM